VDLRSALSKAKKDTLRAQGRRGSQIQWKQACIDLEVVPLRVAGSSERFFLVVS